MELEKRKRESEGGSNGKRGKSREKDDGSVVKRAAPADEEVEEFFAILKRIQVAVKYFQRRDGADLTAATPWNPSFKQEDFNGAKKNPRGSGKNVNPGLDLNSDPVPEESPDNFSGSV